MVNMVQLNMNLAALSEKIDALLKKLEETKDDRGKRKGK